MYRVTKSIWTETAHRLMHHPGRCAHLHGHSYEWRITVDAERLDEQGMVIDFSDLKRLCAAVLDPLDHATLLHESDPLVELLPRQRLITVPFPPTAEHLAAYVGCELAQSIGELHGPRVHLARIELWETRSSSVAWEPAR